MRLFDINKLTIPPEASKYQLDERTFCRTWAVSPREPWEGRSSQSSGTGQAGCLARLGPDSWVEVDDAQGATEADGATFRHDEPTAPCSGSVPEEACEPYQGCELCFIPSPPLWTGGCRRQGPGLPLAAASRTAGKHTRLHGDGLLTNLGSSTCIRPTGIKSNLPECRQTGPPIKESVYSL